MAEAKKGADKAYVPRLRKDYDERIVEGDDREVRLQECS